MGLQYETLQLRGEWAGFDLLKVGGAAPRVYRCGELVIISGCITTVSPMKNQAGWDISIGWVDPRCVPHKGFTSLAPMAMSRYEGINQCGTSTTLKPDGKLTINFNKNTNPMVLHLSGICTILNSEPVMIIPVAQYQMRDWMSQSTRTSSHAADEDDHWALQANEDHPPVLHLLGSWIFLEGELKEATYGPISHHVATLPEGYRPRREVRWLANLLRSDEAVVEHSVALTIRPNGTMSVQGGKVHMVDAKGNVRLMQQKKKGRLSLDGIRFSLVEGEGLQPSHLVGGPRASGDTGKATSSSEDGKSKLGYLISSGSRLRSSASSVKQNDLVMLEGHLSWSAVRSPNTKQPVAVLPPGHWPLRRETFFTRGSSDLEERRRVDIDVYGRIFCPEGAPNGRVELTGILFVAAEASTMRPRDPDWDELKLQYQRNDVNVVSTSFDGHELLEQFVCRSNHHEWRFIEYDFGRHAGRKMLLPLGQAKLRGNQRYDPMNLGSKNEAIWHQSKAALSEKFGITTFYTLLHVSNGMFDRIAAQIHMREGDQKYIREKREKFRQQWDAQRESGLTFSHLQSLATDIVDQMFEHWDFRAQLQGALQNDFRAPNSIEHLFPQRRNYQDKHISRAVQPHEMAKFEEIRQFFHLYETTGTNMTHCSLMGSQDMFTTTGKWHFPDAAHVQKQLFDNIAWLFPKGLYLYISERQTQRFPFIEDLDIQCSTDWEGPLPPGEKPMPPDSLIMKPPVRDPEKDVVYGDPGELMRRRASAVHMIYPHLESLEVIVYTASGYNKGKDMLKSSFHLVWPQLIVDPDRAPVIRHATLGVFHQETRRPGSFLAHLQNRLLQLHDSNNWELVFDSTTINARNGLRLPYSDKASMVIDNEQDKERIKKGMMSKNKAFKKRVKENRPSKALGVIRFEFDKDPQTGNDIMTSAKWISDIESKTISDWISAGTCRRDPNNIPELTPWQLGPDVLRMLPVKPGEEFYFEGEADGEGGHWVTHKPFPNIRRYQRGTLDFVREFSDALKDEQDTLQEEQQNDLLRHIVGSWVSVTEKQAIWRGTAAAQCEAKVPDRLWGMRKMRRPAEVIFLKSKGKVMIDGPPEVTEAIIRALKTLTRLDDNAVMPIYDVVKMS